MTLTIQLLNSSTGLTMSDRPYLPPIGSVIAGTDRDLLVRSYTFDQSLTAVTVWCEALPLRAAEGEG